MRLWTSQTIEFYKELMRNGIAYCTRVSEFAQRMILHISTPNVSRCTKKIREIVKISLTCSTFWNMLSLTLQPKLSV
jgi:hypothetical protein